MQPTRIQTPEVTKAMAYDALQRHTSIEVKNSPIRLWRAANTNMTPLATSRRFSRIWGRHRMAMMH